MVESVDTLIFQIEKQLPQLQRNYQRGINQDLSQHRWQGTLERQLLAMQEAWLGLCSQKLAIICSEREFPYADQQQLLEPLILMKDKLVAWALRFNSSSCALSNFGEEHVPGSAYLSRILLQVESRWHHWCQELRLDGGFYGHRHGRGYGLGQRSSL